MCVCVCIPFSYSRILLKTRHSALISLALFALFYLAITFLVYNCTSGEGWNIFGLRVIIRTRCWASFDHKSAHPSFRIHIDVWVKDNVHEFTAGAIASDATVKVASIIPGAFISRNAAKPLWDAAPSSCSLSPAHRRKCLKRRFCWSVRSLRERARGALQIKARKRYSDIFLDSALSCAAEALRAFTRISREWERETDREREKARARKGSHLGRAV